jgi:predicted ester cyclase
MADVVAESTGNTEELNTAVIKRYLRVFETLEVGELKEIVAEDVIGHGAGHTVQGRHWVENSVVVPGLSACRVRIDDLFAARDRVTVSFTMTYAHDRTGKDVSMTGTKCYKFRDGKIVELWGETDFYGFLRQLGLVPEEVPAM